MWFCGQPQSIAGLRLHTCSTCRWLLRLRCPLAGLARDIHLRRVISTMGLIGQVSQCPFALVLIPIRWAVVITRDCMQILPAPRESRLV